VWAFWFRFPGEGAQPGLRVPGCYPWPAEGQPAADEHDDILINPVAIFEVLSPSTEKYDRGLKFQLYRAIDSLKHYLLVSQDQVRIEQFTRQPDGIWTLRDCLGLDEELKIDSIGIAIPLRRIYERVISAPSDAS
jgi:Uma2 family endonuclease